MKCFYCQGQYGPVCDCLARIAKVIEHTRTSTPHGPDYCAECSTAVSEWVQWPCPSVEFTTDCTDECLEDCMADHRGEE